MNRRLIDRLYELHKEVKESYNFQVFAAEHLGYIDDPCYLENTYDLIKSHDLDDTFPLRKRPFMPLATTFKDVFERIEVRENRLPDEFIVVGDVPHLEFRKFFWGKPSRAYRRAFEKYNGPFGNTKTFNLLGFSVSRIDKENFYAVYENLGGVSSSWHNLVAIINIKETLC